MCSTEGIEILIEIDYDPAFIHRDQLPMVRQVVILKNITLLNIYGKYYNKHCNKYPVRVKNAQSMLQILFRSVSSYLPTGIDRLDDE